MSESMMQLEKIIQSPNERRELINHVMHLKTGQLITKIRFIATVCQYEQCSEKHERNKMAQKISFIFIRPEAIFSILSLQDNLRKKILLGNDQCLVLAKNEMLRELCSTYELLNFVRL